MVTLAWNLFPLGGANWDVICIDFAYFLNFFFTSEGKLGKLFWTIIRTSFMYTYTKYGNTGYKFLASRCELNSYFCQFCSYFKISQLTEQNRKIPSERYSADHLCILFSHEIWQHWLEICFLLEERTEMYLRRLCTFSKICLISEEKLRKFFWMILCIYLYRYNSQKIWPHWLKMYFFKSVLGSVLFIQFDT